MSLFFESERRPKTAVVEPIPDWEAALECVSHRYDPHVVAAHGHISVEQARHLERECRRVEPLLLTAIQDGTVTTQASATDFLRANTEGFFPAAKFLARMKENIGSDVSPSTWAKVVDAAKAEDIG